jgi:hypothetical protein
MRVRAVLLFVVTAIGGGLVFQLAHRALASEPSGTFEIRDVEWKRSEVGDPSSFHNVAYYGSGRLVGTGQYATGRYLVFVGLIRAKRVVPSAAPDTVIGVLPFVDGPISNAYGQWDFGQACPDAPVPYHCARKLQEPELHFRVLGWVRLVSDTLAQSDTGGSSP